MKYKVGQELYSCWADCDTGRINVSVYKIRTIRGGYVYAILLLKYVTWVKKSKKHYDWGWDDSIPGWLRRKVKVGEKFTDIFTTKRQAYLDCKKTTNSGRFYTPEIKAKAIRSINRQITKIDNNKS